MMDSKSDEESPFTVTHDSSNLVSIYVYVCLWFFFALLSVT